MTWYTSCARLGDCVCRRIWRVRSLAVLLIKWSHLSRNMMRLRVS